jgi:hypothetical protein
MEVGRVTRLVVADPHHFDGDPDPHQGAKSDPDPQRSEKSDPYSHQSENRDSDTQHRFFKWIYDLFVRTWSPAVAEKLILSVFYLQKSLYFDIFRFSGAEY